VQESTVTVKGQTTLPRDVRHALGLASGDKVRYVILDGEVRLLKSRPVNELAGILAKPGRRPVSPDEMERAIAAGATDDANSKP
jgi:antitoxin PrlF